MNIVLRRYSNLVPAERMTDPAPSDFSRFRLKETYKSLTGLGTEVLKALILVNGAAAAGELTFIGSILEKHKEALPGLVSGLVAYAIGVFLASFAFVVGFISQTLGYIADRENRQDRTSHYVTLWSAIILIFLSSFLFIYGTVTNGNALRKLF